jgi:hypothetical protein
MPNYRGKPQTPSTEGPDLVLQDFAGSASAGVGSFFEGADNEDNLSTVGFRVAPPDTDGDVGPNHYVQMINMVTTIFDKNGNIIAGGGPFASNVFWSGQGGNCEPFNQGDPVVVYDEVADRWLVSQFAFDDNFTTFSQCVAISQTGDPTGAYNRYEFDFDGIGFPDYPKHGIVTDSITMMANIFAPPTFFFTGTFLGVMDKAAMYAGSSATLIGFKLSSNEFGFVAGDLDGPGNAPALFATAMSSRRPRFDIWQATYDFPSGTGQVDRIARLQISGYDANFCSASREACVPQPNGGPALETLSDRLMHRLQIRDFGTHRSMVAAHTVDVGGGRAGIRWYELRESAGSWSMYQHGTYAPDDGLNRWVPSIAMNSAGDIGLGFSVSSTTEPLSSRAAGQSAANSGTGILDATEVICRMGITEQAGSARAGDYSSTNVDPVTDSFWHTNEYGQRNDKSAGWGTTVCEFSLSSSPPPACIDNDEDGYGASVSSECLFSDVDCDDSDPAVNPGAMEICNDGIDNDCDGSIDGADSDCTVSQCTEVGFACREDFDCCSQTCSRGKPSTRVCLP